MKEIVNLIGSFEPFTNEDLMKIEDLDGEGKMKIIIILNDIIQNIRDYLKIYDNK
jgi:hypothetical protein